MTFFVPDGQYCRNRQALFDEVEDLRDKSRKHFDELSKALNENKIAESKLDDAEKAIKTDRENIKDERDQWKKTTTNLILARDRALIAKGDAEAKLTEEEQDLANVRFKLKVAEGKIVAVEERAKQSEEQWFAEWQTTHACDDYNVEVGHKSQGEDEALKRALVATCPSLEWNYVWSKYEEMY